MQKKQVGIILLVILFFAGCGKSVEEQIQEQLNMRSIWHRPSRLREGHQSG